jgi:exopolysaccharide biosynthesis polyprenyl glycosylphosphotransferase
MAFSDSLPFTRASTVEFSWTKPKRFRQHHPKRRTSSHRFDNAVVRESSLSQLTAKRLLDIFGSAAGLLIMAPLLIGIVTAIKLTSPGPVFFRQKRYGYHNRRFWIFKFRTMYMDRSDQRGTHQTTADDPRVTPLGRLLRKTSLDELPQLINVLKGDMSLVGPRPPLPVEVAQYSDDVRRRLLVRPGVTGLWQVSGRSDLEWVESVRLDLRYVENWTLALDALILVKTVRAVLSGGGAY